MVCAVLPKDYRYFIEDEKFCSPTNYECNLRIRGIKSEEQARKWIDELNELSLVTWKILRTYPKSGKINIYKAEFRCQHRVHGKRKDLKKSKNTNCPARLRVCIRRYLKSTHAKTPDPLIKIWPCLIELKNTHNHSVESPDSLQYRPVNELTKNKIKLLFSKGHSPNSVSDILRLHLLLTNPEFYEEREKDASFCPLPAFCYREYSKVNGFSYRSRDRKSLQSELESLLNPYISEEEGGRAVISIVSDHLVVCICTPLMQRVHGLISGCRSIVRVELFGNTDKKQRIFIFSTWTEVGDIPIGIIMSDSDELLIFKTGLQLLKTILPIGSFYGSEFPQIFILNEDDSKRRDALINEFPDSCVLYSPHQIQKQIIEFLNDKSEMKEVYKKFKNLLNSASDDDLLIEFEKLKEMGCSYNLIGFDSLLDKIWNDTIGFSTIFRPGLFLIPLLIPPESTQSISRLINNGIFNRTKNFNLLQLTDFLITTYEEYHTLKLSNPSYSDSLLKNLLPSSNTIDLVKIKKLTNGLYEVPEEIISGREYNIVDMDLIFCSCTHKNITICSHQGSVIQKYYGPSLPFPFHLQNLFLDVAGKDTNISSTTITKKKKSKKLISTQSKLQFQESEEEESKKLLQDINEWFKGQLNYNPIGFLPALRRMRSRLESMNYDEGERAVNEFGTGIRPIKISSNLPSKPPPPPPSTTTTTTLIQNVEEEEEEEDTTEYTIYNEEYNSNNYVSIEEFNSNNPVPDGYFILVTPNSDNVITITDNNTNNNDTKQNIII